LYIPFVLLLLHQTNRKLTLKTKAMDTIYNLDEILKSEIEEQIESHLKCIEYCKSQIDSCIDDKDKWAIKEYESVIADRKINILELSARLTNFYK